MKFTNKAPKWDAEGIAPPESLQKSGFLAGYKPPAHYFNYLFNGISKAINEVQTGLSNVDNTADAKKPVSTEQKAAIDAMAISDKGAGKIISVADAANAPFNTFNAYGASQQETTKGEQLFNASKIATNTSGGATVNNNGDGSFTISGSGALTASFETRYYVSPEELKKLFKTGTLYLKTESVTFPFLYVNLYKDNSFISTILSNKHKASTSVELLEEYFDGTYSLYIGFNGATDDKEIAANTIKPVMYQDGDGTFEKFTGGVTAPNLDYQQVINSTGDNGSLHLGSCAKNLYNCRDVAEKFNVGTIADDDYITIQCDNSTGTGVAYQNQWTNIIRALKPNTNYKLVVEVKEIENCSLFAISRKTTENTESQFVENVIIDTVGKHEKIVRTNDDTFWVDRKAHSLRTFVSFDAGKVGKCVFRLSLLQENDADTTYRAYEGVKAVIPLTQPLYGVGEVTDVLTHSSIIRKFACIIFDGSEDEMWNRDFTKDADKMRMVTNVLKGAIKNTANYEIANVMCNMFTRARANDTYSLLERISVDDIGRLHVYSERFNNSVDNWTAFLANNPLIVVYELAEPIEESLTTEQLAALYGLHSYEGYSTVYTEDMGELELEYFKNTDNGKAAGIVKQDCQDIKVMLGNVNTALDNIIGGA